MLRRATAALGLAASVAGLPFVLMAAAGPPSLEGLPTWTWLRTGMHNQYLPLDPLLRLLALLAWLLWLYLVLTVALRTLAVVAARLHLAGASALLVATELLTLPRLRHVVDAAVGMSLLASSVSHAPAGPPAHHPQVAAVSTQVMGATGPTAWERTRILLDVGAQSAVVQLASDAHRAAEDAGSPSSPPTTPATDEDSEAPTYVVQPGDSLWQIAEQRLGDPLRWHELWQLNRDKRMPDGRTLDRPGLILPGWVLRLPGDADRSQAAPSDGSKASQAPGAGTAAQDHGGIRPPLPQPRERTTTPERRQERHGVDADRKPSETDEQPAPSHVIELPSGAVVGLSLALAISAALALARLHRRRRWQPSDPAPGITHTDPLVTDTVRRLEHAAHVATSPGEPVGEEDQADGGAEGPAVEAEPAAPVLARPPSHPFGVVAVGHRDGEEIAIDLPATGGLALTGPGAAAAIRAVAVSALATVQIDSEVVIADTDLADRLLPGIPTVPGLTVARDLDAALRHLEVELLYRTRLLDDTDVTSLTEFRAINPAEPLPLLLLVTATPPPILAGRLTAVLESGKRLDIAAVVLGDIPGISALTVDADGRLDMNRTALSDPLQPLAFARLFTLGADQARETLELLAASRGEPPATPSPPKDASAPSPTEIKAVSDGNGTPTAAERRATTPATIAPARGQAGPEPPPIHVRVLGPLRIETRGSQIRTGLRGKARELLVLLLIHPDGIDVDVAIETLWPGAPPPRGAERLQTVISNLRTTLKSAAQLGNEKVIIHAQRRYTIDADLIDCDLWRFQATLATAASATDSKALASTLDQAVADYGGALAEGERFPWAEAPREDLRRRALNAATRLAELHQQAGRLDVAVTALEKAVTWDRQAEELYRRIMRLQATLGRPHAVQRAYDQLAAHLDDLDEEPDDDTRQLFDELLRSTGRRPGL
jgi:DNA-binding SARP family transcriptional activator